MSHQPRVTIIGAGALGSWTTALLAKLGVRRMHVYDGDVVALHNLPTTTYCRGDVGRKKVSALAEQGRTLGATIIRHPSMYRGARLPATDILISAVDSMDVRRVLFAEASRQGVPFFIDARTGGEALRVYAIRPDQPFDRRLYRSTLVPNKRVTPIFCTVIDVVGVATSLIARAVRQWVVLGQYTPEIVHRQEMFSTLVSGTRHRRRR